jgi:hypothetical protein
VVRLTAGYFALERTQLATALGQPEEPQFAVAKIRNLRERISRELRRKANLLCDDNGVVVRDEQGYGFAVTVSLSVQFDAGQTMHAEHGRDNADEGIDDGDVRDPNVFDVPNVRDQVPAFVGDVRDLDSAVSQNVRDPLAIADRGVRDRDENNISGETPGDPGNRTSWIIRQLASGRLLRAPEMARELGCSVKTIQRDLDSLKGKITFVGHPRTGYFRLLDQAHDGPSTTPSSS